MFGAIVRFARLVDAPAIHGELPGAIAAMHAVFLDSLIIKRSLTMNTARTEKPGQASTIAEENEILPRTRIAGKNCSENSGQLLSASLNCPCQEFALST
jgi:hypothetical protein